MTRPDPYAYGSAYMACGLLFLLAPPAGLLMLAVVTANLVDEWTTERSAEKSRRHDEEVRRLSDNYGFGPILRYGDDRYGTKCRCHRQMGNDFYFLPMGQCLHGKCDAEEAER